MALKYMKRFYFDIVADSEDVANDIEETLSDAVFDTFSNIGGEDRGATIEYGNDDVEPITVK